MTRDKTIGIDMKMFSVEGWSITAALALLVGMSGSLMKVETKDGKAVSDASRLLSLISLPYAEDALEPYISAYTVGLHYNKHHKGYLDNLNQLLGGSTLESGNSLDKIISESAGIPEKASVYDNAAQVRNHDFFWKSMKPGGGGKPAGRMMGLIVKSFGNYDEFRSDFVNAAGEQSGGGWVWLVQDGERLKISRTSNADVAMPQGGNALLVCDVWEHAYYLDYQSRRTDFVKAFLDNLVNWDFAVSQLK